MTMKPDPATPDEPARLLRQQLILAQVRIMELEDVRDELVPRVADLEKLLTDAQQLADRKAAESAHLETVRADLQTQFEHLRHMQHVTHQALEQTRAELGAVSDREKLLLDEIGRLQLLITQQAGMNQAHLKNIGELQARLDATRAESASRLARLQELDAEQHVMKASRSWRWTAWLRSCERALASRKP